MKNFYEVGRVYVWQNMPGSMAFLNGTECTVTGPVECYQAANFYWYWGHPTDTIASGAAIMARPGFLRPKDPPAGERSVLALFTQPVLEPA